MSLGLNGYTLTVAGRRLKYSVPVTGRPYRVRRFRLPWNRGPLFYAVLNMRFLVYLLQTKVDIILANDLDTLPACFLAARLRGKKLVFDSHELFSEVPELVHRRYVRRVWQFFERLLIPRIKFGITVSQSIADHYQQLYGTSFLVIRNAGRFKYDHEFEPAIASRERLIIYQGVLNLGRGLEMLIKSMKYLDQVKLWIVGGGDIGKKLKSLTGRLKLRNQVDFVGRLPIDDLWKFTSQASIGVSLEEDLGLNYQYALPNKLFDYIQARIPVIVSDLPEMKALVNQYGIGEVLTDRSPEGLASQIREMLQSKIPGEKYRVNLELAARELCWEREEEKLVTFFKRVSNPAWEPNSG